MKNIGKIMEQVQKMQSDMKAAQDRLALMEVEGQSGAGLVKVKMNGQGMFVQIWIDSSLIKEDEKDVLEDLIIAASNDAKTKMDQLTADEMGKVTQGISLPPGMQMPF
jgi:DNA-binding YbaB/EbfC family protein